MRLRLAWLALLWGCADQGPLWVERLPATAPAASSYAPRDSFDLLQSQPLPAHARLGRVDLRPKPSKESARQELERGRAKQTRILSDQRLAWSLPFGEELVVALPEGDWSGATLLFDAAVESGHKPNETGAVIGVSLLVDGARQELTRGTLNLARPKWSALSAVLPEQLEAGTQLAFSAGFQETAPALQNLRFAIGAPTLTRVQKAATPDVIVISIDTLRADRLGCYGYDRATSPRLDAWAAKGALFEQCSSPSPWTLPAYGSLFTGLYPTEHRAGVPEKAAIWSEGGAREDFPGKSASLAPTTATLAESMSRAGYLTAGIYANPFLNPNSAVDRGFGSYTWYQYNAHSAVKLAEEWWTQKSSAPRFLFLQVTDPHYPYAPPGPWDEAFAGRSVSSIAGYPKSLQSLRQAPPSPRAQKLMGDLYDAEIAFTDEQLGRFIDFVREREGPAGTLIVLHSDHGEELWDHGGFEHGHSLYEELLHVPLVFSWPGQLAPRRIPNHVRSIDIFPTLVDLLGLPLPEELRGTSLGTLLKGEPSERQLVGYSEAILWGRPVAPFDEAKSFTIDGYKLVVGDNNSQVLLFNLLEDHGEQVNLATEDPTRTAYMRARLEEHFARAASRAGRGVAMGINAAERERLRALGYFGDEE